MRVFKVSSFLEHAANNKLIYHSLFGNLSRISETVEEQLFRLKGQEFTESIFTKALGEVVVEQLFQSYFLLHKEEDERSLTEKWLDVRKGLISKGSLFETLQISASNNCNFSCAYCFADASDARSAIRAKISRETPSLQFDTACVGIDTLLKNANRHEKKFVGVKFLGREPLVNWKTIKQLLAYYREAPIQWSMTTNGSLITEEIARELVEHSVRVVVSLDGPEKVNNRLRVLHDGSGSYLMVMRGIELLKAAGVRFSVSSVISEECDAASYIDFANRLIDYGAHDFELTLAMQTKQLKPQEKFESTETLISFLLEIYRHCSQNNVLVHGDWIDPFHRLRSTSYFRGDLEVSRPLGASCSASQHQISLESNGDMFPCRAMSSHYGHVNDLESVLSSTTYHETMMRTYYNVLACRGCQLEGHCQGTCLGSCEEVNDDLYSPQAEYCNLYRIITQRLLETLV